MARKSFVTSMPDRAGAFIKASEVIARRGGNIVRVSYNKAVDPRMLFVDVEAPHDCLLEIERDLRGIGYLNNRIAEKRVIEVSVRIPDTPGAVLPVLRVLRRYEINISYMNSAADGRPYQDFKFGLLIEAPDIIKTLLDDIGEIYPVDVIECESSEENLDNTVFYIRLANEMRRLLGLDDEDAMRFLAESNRILQVLQAGGEDARKVFSYIRGFAAFVSSHRAQNYKTNIQRIAVRGAEIISIQPLCGSNTYVLLGGDGATVIDTGYAIYRGEFQETLRCVCPGWDDMTKRVYITHADIDHCGLLESLGAEVFVNKKSAEGFERQAAGLPDYREQTELHTGYSKISRIISGYRVPDTSRFNIIDSGTPEEHDGLIKIGEARAGSLRLDIYEGSGGHLRGETVYVCESEGIIFTGDILVNIEGFSKERAEFNSLAPFLMKSVNVDSKKAGEMRRRINGLAGELEQKSGRPCIILGGHGPVSEMMGGRLVGVEGDIRIDF